MKEIGLAIIGQTGDLVPADKKLYALRDVTATVDIVPLIASSIMSKKLAGGADAIVLDVKVGDGAFMKTLEDARILAEQMVDLGRRAGREVVCLLTDMDQPLGAAVGHALEIREAAETIRGRRPAGLHRARPRRLRTAARALRPRRRSRGGPPPRGGGDEGRLRDCRLRALDRGARRRSSLDALPRAPVVREVSATADGVVTGLGALAIGVAALELGAGRRTKDDDIDHAVGVVCHVKRGERSRAASTSQTSTRGTTRRPTTRSWPSSTRTASGRAAARTASCSTSSSSARAKLQLVTWREIFLHVELSTARSK